MEDKAFDSRAPHEVILSVPSGTKYQLIFATDLNDIPVHQCAAGVHFVYCRGPLDLLRHLSVLKRMGVTFVAKAALKLLTPSRSLYFARNKECVMHVGWVTKAACKYYPVTCDDAVIGPILSLPSARGRGLATYCLSEVLSILKQSGCVRVYIDTQNDNRSCLRVIEKTGFGTAVGMYLKATKSA